MELIETYRGIEIYKVIKMEREMLKSGDTYTFNLSQARDRIDSMTYQMCFTPMQFTISKSKIVYQANLLYNMGRYFEYLTKLETTPAIEGTPHNLTIF